MSSTTETTPATHTSPATLRGDKQFAQLCSKGPRHYCPHTDQTDQMLALKDRDIHIIVLPSNSGSSRGGITDTKNGPHYVNRILAPTLKAGGANVTSEVIPVKKLTTGTVEGNDNIINAQKILKLICYGRDRFYQAIMAGKLPILLGGDHSSLICATGALKAYPDLADAQYSEIVFFLWDGDTDFRRDPRVENPNHTKGNAHGRTVSILQGRGPDVLMPVMDGVPLLRPENTVFLGGQRVDQVEVKYIHETKCTYLGLDALTGQPDAVDAFLTEAVRGRPYHWSFDPDLLAAGELVRNPKYKPGAPMASLEGLRTDLFLRYCRTLGMSAGKLVSLEASEVAPKCDAQHGGITRQLTVGGITRVLTGGDHDYRIDYDPFS